MLKKLVVVLVCVLLVGIPVSAQSYKCEELHSTDADDFATVIMGCVLQHRQVNLVDPDLYPVFRPVNLPKRLADIVITSNRRAWLLPIITEKKNSPFIYTGDDGVRYYKPVIYSYLNKRLKLANIGVDLRYVPMEWGIGAHAVSLWRSNGAEVTDLRVSGDESSAENQMPAGGDWGGIKVTYSKNVLMRDGKIYNVGGVSRHIGQSIPNEGIRWEGSAEGRIIGNTIVNVAIGVGMVNTTKLEYDSSSTIIRGNKIWGVALSDNPYTPSSRGLKLFTGAGANPLTNLTVEDNELRDTGGHNFKPGGDGILLLGVRNSTFARNKILGDPSLEFGLQVRDEFEGSVNPSADNIFTGNVFVSGKTIPCDKGNCWDVAWMTRAQFPDGFRWDNKSPNDKPLTIRFPQ